ncbi:MAG: biotin/lipoyl-binding protein, partial [Kofleriaceae bacterium]
MRRVLPVVLLAVVLVAYIGYKRYLALWPFEWAGSVESRAVTVGSRVGGRIAEIRVHEGDLVKPGQVLIVLEPGDL